jgi:peptidyl-prolyl cis-trans isomerase D
MLLKMLRKKKVAKRIFWVLAILILPAFVLWGSGSIIRGRGGPTYAGKIFGRKISFDEFAKEYQACRHQAIMMYGDQFNRLAKYLNLEEVTWNRLILLEEVKRQKIKVMDREVVEEITHLAFFQRNGQFDQRFYVNLLEYAFRTNPREFEEEIRKSLMISKLYALVSGQIDLKDGQIKDEYRKENERIKVSYVFILPKDFEGGVNLEDKEVEEYFKAKTQEFKRPERVNVEYVGIDYASIESTLSITDEELKEYYDLHQEEFKLADKENEHRQFEETKEIIKTRLTFERSREIVEEKIEEIDRRLKIEPDLEKISKEFSLKIDRTGLFSAEDSIPNIGWSYEFANAAFSLRLGKLSSPIKTEKGCYIIKVKEKKEPYLPSLEEVKQEVRLVLRDQKARELAKEKAKEYLSKIKVFFETNPQEDFAQIAKDLSLKFGQTDAFTRRGYISGIGINEDFSKTAFSLSKGEVSDVVETPQGFYILRLDEFLPIDEAKFSQEKEEFKKNLLLRKKEENFQRFFAKLKEKAQLQSNISSQTFPK